LSPPNFSPLLTPRFFFLLLFLFFSHYVSLNPFFFDPPLVGCLLPPFFFQKNFTAKLKMTFFSFIFQSFPKFDISFCIYFCPPLQYIICDLFFFPRTLRIFVISTFPTSPFCPYSHHFLVSVSFPFNSFLNQTPPPPYYFPPPQRANNSGTYTFLLFLLFSFISFHLSLFPPPSFFFF